MGHQLFSLITYGALLCSLAHGTFRENEKRRSFRPHADTEMTFLHRNECEQPYPLNVEYSLVLKETGGREVVFSKQRPA